MSYADDNTTYTFSPDLDANLKRLKTSQLRYMNGFIKSILNLTLINAILSQPLASIGNPIWPAKTENVLHMISEPRFLILAQL